MMCEHCRSIQTWRKFDAPRDYLACIAYLDGLRPSLVMCRGYYERTALAAYNFDGKS